MTDDPNTAIILYVEDEIFVQDEMISELNNAGFTLLVADSGEEAMEILATERRIIDIVLTDVNLGRGPTGWNVARRARLRSPHIAVIYASSVEEREWMINGVPLSTLIIKPFTPSLVIEALLAHLAGKSPDRAMKSEARSLSPVRWTDDCACPRPPAARKPLRLASREWLV